MVSVSKRNNLRGQLLLRLLTASMPSISLAHEKVRFVRNVWHSNFDVELKELQKVAEAPGSVLALDTEFPGNAIDAPYWSRSRQVQYDALRHNVELLRPIQIGIAVMVCAVSSAAVAAATVASEETAAACGAGRGSVREVGSEFVVQGVWSFNLMFDLNTDHYREDSIHFLRKAGIDFGRHASEGIDPSRFGRSLASSSLVGKHAPLWVTFAGLYDLGYILKLLLGSGCSLPSTFDGFDGKLDEFCPCRSELREYLRYGSLESHAQEHGIQRTAAAHTAGSDALVTLELFAKVIPADRRLVLLKRPDPTTMPDPASPELTPVANSWVASARWAMLGHASRMAAAENVEAARVHGEGTAEASALVEAAAPGVSAKQAGPAANLWVEAARAAAAGTGGPGECAIFPPRPAANPSVADASSSAAGAAGPTKRSWASVVAPAANRDQVPQQPAYALPRAPPPSGHGTRSSSSCALARRGLPAKDGAVAGVVAALACS